MVKCISCGKLVKFDGQKCEECGHEYSFEEIKILAVQEKSASDDLNLRLMLKDRIYRLEYIGTILLFIGLVLLVPAFLNIQLYIRAVNRVNVVSEYAQSVYATGMFYGILSFGSLIGAAVCYIIRGLGIRKTKMLKYYSGN